MCGLGDPDPPRGAPVRGAGLVEVGSGSSGLKQFSPEGEPVTITVTGEG